MNGGSLISVVIPAHNEESVIGRCLSSLTSGDEADKLTIIVVCNGCSDRTAHVASQFAGVKVVSIDVASKIAALNEGDRHVDCYPVAYVDADIDVTARDLVVASRGLNSRVKITAPRVQIDVEGSGLLVKAFYSVWTRLPYFSTDNLVGSGIFVLSAEGRRRFSAFPDLVADDGYVRGLFDNEERKTVDGCHFTVFAPKDIASLIKIKTRVRYGNMQVAAHYPSIKVGGENTSRAFLTLMLRRPWLLPAGVVYVLVQSITKRRALARFQSQAGVTWDRDHSSRTSR